MGTQVLHIKPDFLYKTIFCIENSDQYREFSHREHTNLALSVVGI